MSCYDFTFIILLLGDSTAGKHYITDDYGYNLFNRPERLTIGVEFHVKTIELDGKKIKIQLWDVGEPVRFRFLHPTYCLHAHAAMILYDTTNSNSLDKLAEYINIIRKKAGYWDGAIPIMLVGSYFHLENKKREVSREQGKLMAEKYKLSGYTEIPSQYGQNIKEALKTLARLILEKMRAPSIQKHTPSDRRKGPPRVIYL